MKPILSSLLASITVLAAAIAVATTVTSTDAHAGTAHVARTCTLLVGQRDRGFAQVGNAPKGESPGDLFAITETLLTDSGHRIGRADISAVETDAGRHIAEITVTFSLPRGTIDVQAAQHFKRTSFTAAVTGRTGTYRAARGTVSLDGTHSRYIFQLSGAPC